MIYIYIKHLISYLGDEVDGVEIDGAEAGAGEEAVGAGAGAEALGGGVAADGVGDEAADGDLVGEPVGADDGEKVERGMLVMELVLEREKLSKRVVICERE